MSIGGGSGGGGGIEDCGEGIEKVDVDVEGGIENVDVGVEGGRKDGGREGGG